MSAPSRHNPHIELPDPDPTNDTDRPTLDTQLQEREVRLTAQRLLTSHLRSDSAVFWNDIAIDLTGATLIDFVIIKGASRWASFKSTTFSGNAIFIQTTFPEYINFEQATFTEDAHFVETTFNGDARFQNTTFSGNAKFGGLMKSEVVNFAKTARFQGATFNRAASFAEATFTGPAYFGQALPDKSTTFVGNASFFGARFKNSVNFRGATFADTAEFKKSLLRRKGAISGSRVGGAHYRFPVGHVHQRVSLGSRGVWGQSAG